MKTARFVRDTRPEREGGPGYKAGDVVQMHDAQFERWHRRSAVQLVTQEQEPADGNPVDSPSDVGGEGGAGAGDGSEPAGAAEAVAEGAKRGGKRRGQ